MGFLGNVSQWRKIAKEGVAQTSLVAKFLCLLHLADNHLVSSTLVYGPSMLPTLNPAGDVLLVEHVSHRLEKLAPGDVVLLRSPLDPKKSVTKRILGMEGDTITYLSDPTRSHSSCTVVVPRGHIWIQGDNMYASRDSRYYGAVPYGLIQGKVLLRVWPVSSFGPLGQ